MPTAARLATIGAYAFYKTGIYELNFNNALVSIGEGAFASIGNIRSLNIPSSIESIGVGAFSNNLALSYVHFQADVQDLAGYQGGVDAQEILTYLADIIVKVPSNAHNLIAYFKALGYHDSLDLVDDPSLAQNLFLYTPASCFEYEETDGGLKIVGMKNTADHVIGSCEYCKDAIYFPDQINGKSVVAVASSFASNVSATVSRIEFNTELKVIEANAFRNLTALDTVVFGTRNESELVSIGTAAFVGTSIKVLTVNSENLDSIGDFAFAGVGVETVTLTHVVSIGKYSFSNVSIDENNVVLSKQVGTLTSLTVYFETDGSIGEGAFMNNANLRTMGLNNGLTTIGDYAFMGTSLVELRSANVSNTIERIGDYAFANTLISFVPDQVMTIGKFAFARGVVIDGDYTTVSFDKVTTLKNVTLRRVVSIDEGAFAGTSLLTLNLPSTLEYLFAPAYAEDGEHELIGAIEYTEKLQYVSITDSEYYKVIKGAIYHIDGERATLIGYPRDLSNADAKYVSSFKTYKDEPYLTITIGMGVSVADGIDIGVRAFAYTQIDSVILNDSYYSIGRKAFYECKELDYVSLRSSSVETIGEYAFYGCTELVDCDGVGEHELNYQCMLRKQTYGTCSGYSAFVSSNYLTTIGAHAFDGCIGLTSVASSTEALNIGAYAYANTSISKIALPANVVMVEEGALNTATVVQLPIMNQELTLAKGAFKSGVKIYYASYREEENTLNNTYAQDAVTAYSATSTCSVYAHYAWLHFSFDEEDGLKIEGLADICQNHTSGHTGENVLAPRYSQDGTEIVGLPDSGSFASIKYCDQ
jgi:hypothetical protein